jgi:hypothetical protein
VKKVLRSQQDLTVILAPSLWTQVVGREVGQREVPPRHVVPTNLAVAIKPPPLSGATTHLLF